MVPCLRPPLRAGARIPSRTAVVAVGIALALSACAPGETDRDPGPGPTAVALPFPAPEGVKPEILAPLERLGPCPSPPAAQPDADPEEFALPPLAILTQVEQSGPQTQIQGWIDWTPVQLRVWYQHLSEREIIQAEDEQFESEMLLLTGDGRRLFVKAQAVCAQASVFVAILAPEEDAGSVPTPAGSPAPAPS